MRQNSNQVPRDIPAVEMVGQKNMNNYTATNIAP